MLKRLMGSSRECMQGEQVLSAFKLCRISHLRESAMTRYLRRGLRGPGPPAALEGAWYQAASFRGGRGKLRARDGHRGESAASFTWLHDRHGVNIFVSASYVGTGCRRAGPPPKAWPAQAAVDSATEAPESGWFLAYSSSLGRRVIKRWSLTSLQQRLVKTGGRLVKHARYYWLLLAEGHLTRRLFGDMLRRIWALPVPGG